MRKTLSNYAVFEEMEKKNYDDFFVLIRKTGLSYRKLADKFIDFLVKKEKKGKNRIPADESIINFDFESLLKKYSSGYISDLPYTVRVVFEEFCQSLIGASEEPKLQNKYEIIEAERR